MRSREMLAMCVQIVCFVCDREKKMEGKKERQNSPVVKD